MLIGTLLWVETYYSGGSPCYLQAISSFSIDNCYSPGLTCVEIPTSQLHGSGDASDEASGGVVCLEKRSEKSVVCKLVASKTRVSPLTGVPHPD